LVLVGVEPALIAAAGSLSGRLFAAAVGTATVAVAGPRLHGLALSEPGPRAACFDNQQHPSLDAGRDVFSRHFPLGGSRRFQTAMARALPNSDGAMSRTKEFCMAGNQSSSGSKEQSNQRSGSGSQSGKSGSSGGQQDQSGKSGQQGSHEKGSSQGGGGKNR